MGKEVPPWTMWHPDALSLSRRRTCRIQNKVGTRAERNSGSCVLALHFPVYQLRSFVHSAEELRCSLLRTEPLLLTSTGAAASPFLYKDGTYIHYSDPNSGSCKPASVGSLHN